MTTSTKTTLNNSIDTASDLIESVLRQVCIERARQGYTKEIEFCKKHNIKF